MEVYVHAQTVRRNTSVQWLEPFYTTHTAKNWARYAVTAEFSLCTGCYLLINVLHTSVMLSPEFLQESKIDMSELQLKPEQLAEMVGLIEDGTISGKIGKQILPDLLQVRVPSSSHNGCICVQTHSLWVKAHAHTHCTQVSCSHGTISSKIGKQILPDLLQVCIHLHHTTGPPVYRHIVCG